MRKLKGLEEIIREHPRFHHVPLHAKTAPARPSAHTAFLHTALSVVSPKMGTDGWPFASVDPFPGADVDPLYGFQHVKDLYLRADPNYSGRFTVPVLWDKKQHTIVNNESSEIIRMLNSEFDALVPEERRAGKLDLYPAELRGEIDGVNEWVYDRINSASASAFDCPDLSEFGMDCRWRIQGWVRDVPRGIS